MSVAAQTDIEVVVVVVVGAMPLLPAAVLGETPIVHFADEAKMIVGWPYVFRGRSLSQVLLGHGLIAASSTLAMYSELLTNRYLWSLSLKVCASKHKV
jgi:hypothetical protein